MRTQIFCSVFAVFAFVSAVPACHAQAVAAPERQTYAPAPRTPLRPGVRYTTGSYVVSGPGWEKQLTSGNPNLGHWNWIPVIGYTQSTGTTSRQAVHAPVPEHRSVYVNPNHIALPVVEHGTSKQTTHAKPVAPVHLSKQTASEDEAGYTTHTHAVLSYADDYRRPDGSSGFHSTSTVHGVLAHKGVGAMLSQSMRY
ncbi:MAG: hypothetical protein U0103_10595 [Candidatus Obscuribacterales bacterium]